MAPTDMDLRPVTTALGAEIHGLDLAEPLPRDTVRALRRALLEHKVMFFRDQALTPENQIAFARHFGDLEAHAPGTRLDGFPEIMAIVREPEQTAAMTYDGRWNTDGTYLDKPPMGSVLYALDVPASGGDALWADLSLAYDTLSDGLRRTLETLNAAHSAVPPGPGGRTMPHGGPPSGIDTGAETVHPVVRAHPETGRKSLFVNAGFTRRFDGWSAEESAPLLGFLFAHMARPEFTCRFRWRPNSVAIWDNRCTQHLVLNDYQGQRLEMHRIVISGERPE